MRYLAWGCSILVSSFVNGAPLPVATTGTFTQWTLADTLIPEGTPTRVVESAPGTSSQNRTGSGPFGGTYHGVANASAQPTSIGLSTELTLTDYGRGSYVDNQLANWLPIAVYASARLDDTLTLFGPEPTYSIQLKWQVSGQISTNNANQLTSDVRLIAEANSVRRNRRWLNQDTLTLTDEEVILLLPGIPSNTPVSFYYTAILATWVNDCISDTNGNYSCTAPLTYSGTMSGEFGSTFTLTDFALIGADGKEAASAAYRSELGYAYPGDTQVVPEPVTAALSFAGLAALMLVRRGYRGAMR